MKQQLSSGLLAAALIVTTACGTNRHAAEDGAEGQPQSVTGEVPGSTARPDKGVLEKAPEPGAPLVFEAPDGWVEETPSSDMRKAQYRLPGEPAGGKDASLVVYYFGESGGSVQANVDRWVSQFEQPDGSTSSEALLNSQRRVDGLLVHEIDLSGTYVAETSPGSGVRVNEGDSRMLASIIESDHGHYFVKLVGDKTTVDHWAASYREFITQTKRQR